MKCKKCENEFEGKFCPECGAQAEEITPIQTEQIQPEEQVAQEIVPSEENKSVKKKKTIFLRWWFILIAIITVGVLTIILVPEGEKIVWEDIVLGEMIPEPPGNRGEIINNTSEELSIHIKKISEKQYAEYVADCKEKGFDVEASSEATNFDAHNEQGYKLNISYYGEEISISLEAPMEMKDISWPKSEAGKLLPIPKSTIGNFAYENEDNFFVYIGETTKVDYDEYVSACSEKGFKVDYDKGEDYYFADNSEGWNINLRYEGNNIMSISISAPSEEVEVTTTKKTETTTVKSSNLNSDFKAAMDSYEEFMDEYVAFMKKYKANPTDLSLLSDYSDYMSKYTDFLADFEAWEDEELNAAELAYYIEVQGRVSQKLLEVAE